MEFNMASAVVVTVEGLLIVFSVLIIIMAVLYALRLFAKEELQKAPETPVTSAKAYESITISDVDMDTLDENEKIAIFSAALAAYIDVPISGISITSYKKISD